MKVAQTTLAALVACATLSLAVAYHDADIANYLLNIECFEAEYYSWSAFGHGLTEAQRGGGPPSIGGKKADLGPIQAIGEEFASVHVSHVETIRLVLGPLAVPCPLINIGDVFADAANDALNTTLSPSFSPYDSYLNWMLGALVFQDTVVMAYNWAVSVFRDPGFYTGAAAIGAAEAYHASFLRSALADANGQNIPGIGPLLSAFLEAGDTVVAEVLGFPPPLNQLVVGTFEKSPNIAPVDPYGLTYIVSASSVLNLLYLTFDPTVKEGGFFPNGINGLLGKTRGELVDVCNGPGSARRYHQCGGVGYSGPTCCEGFNTCVFVNDNYSSCQPTPVPANVVKWYGQCGGRNYKGATQCEPDSTCVYKNAYYSQCVPTAA